MQSMAAQGHDATLPHPVRWFVIPAAIWTIAAGGLAILRRRAKEPSVPRMSDEWLNRHPYVRREWDR